MQQLKSCDHFVLHFELLVQSMWNLIVSGLVIVLGKHKCEDLCTLLYQTNHEINEDMHEASNYDPQTTFCTLQPTYMARIQ